MIFLSLVASEEGVDRFESRNMTVVPPTAAAAARARQRFSRPHPILLQKRRRTLRCQLFRNRRRMSHSPLIAHITLPPSLPLVHLFSVIPANDSTLCHRCREANFTCGLFEARKQPPLGSWGMVSNNPIHFYKNPRRASCTWPSAQARDECPNSIPNLSLPRDRQLSSNISIPFPSSLLLSF